MIGCWSNVGDVASAGDERHAIPRTAVDSLEISLFPNPMPNLVRWSCKLRLVGRGEEPEPEPDLEPSSVEEVSKLKSDEAPILPRLPGMKLLAESVVLPLPPLPPLLSVATVSLLAPLDSSLIVSDFPFAFALGLDLGEEEEVGFKCGGAN